MFKEHLKNNDVRYKKLEFIVDVDREIVGTLNHAQSETTKYMLKMPLLRESTQNKEVNLTSTSRRIVHQQSKRTDDGGLQLENLITANWPYFILRDDNTLEAFNDLDCVMLSLWQFEVQQMPKNEYRELYIPMARAMIDLEKMVARKDETPKVEMQLI